MCVGGQCTLCTHNMCVKEIIYANTRERETIKYAHLNIISLLFVFFFSSSSTTNAQQWLWIIKQRIHSTFAPNWVTVTIHHFFYFSFNFSFFLLESHDSEIYYFFFSSRATKRLVQVNEVIWLQCFFLVIHSHNRRCASSWSIFCRCFFFFQFYEIKNIFVIYYVQPHIESVRWWLIYTKTTFDKTVCARIESNKSSCWQ